MQERPAQGVPPDAVQNNAPKKPLGDSFLAGKRYPGEAPPPPPAPPAGPAPGRLFTRVVLPLLIFIGAIGALAWVTQYLPSRKGPGGDTPPPPPPKLTLKFADPSPLADWEPELTKAQWEKLKEQAKREGKDPAEVSPPPPAYAAEYEVTSETHRDGGHYDFAFENPNSERVLVSLESKSCQCASVAACALDSTQWALYQKLKAKADPITRSRQSTEDGLPWKLLSENGASGVLVDPGQHGVIRIFWDGRNQREPKAVSLTTTIAVSPPGKFNERHTVTLGVRVHYVQPVNFQPERLNLGSVSPQNPTVSDVLYCWSATRDLDVAVGPGSKDPCFEVRARKLEKAEDLRELTDNLRAQGFNTRVRSAYRIEVTVYEEKDGKQFDLGTFVRPLNLVVRGKREGAEVERLFPSLPAVRGRVQGDIKVGTFEDEGAINLKNLKAGQFTHVKAKLWAKAGMELEKDISFTPAGLNLTGAKLEELKDASLRNWKVWEIRLSVPPGLEPGPLPEDSAIFLRVKGPNPRRIRIPLIGSVVRG